MGRSTASNSDYRSEITPFSSRNYTSSRGRNKPTRFSASYQPSPAWPPAPPPPPPAKCALSRDVHIKVIKISKNITAQLIPVRLFITVQLYCFLFYLSFWNMHICQSYTILQSADLRIHAVHLQIIIITIIVFVIINISQLRTLFDDTRDRLSDDWAICTNVFAALYIP